MNNQTKEDFWEKPISTYTCEQATEDGTLLDLKVLETKIKGITVANSPFSHITTNLLNKLGYMTENRNKVCGHVFKDVEGKWVRPTMSECPHCYKKANEVNFNYPNLLDLLNQALQILKRNPRGDWLYIGKIETPNGTKQQIYIAKNETGKFTIMLPEDN